MQPWRLPTIELQKKLHVAFAVDNGLVHTHPPIRRAISETVTALARAGHQGAPQFYPSDSEENSERAVSPVTPLEGIDWSEAKNLVGLISGADGGADLRSFLTTGEVRHFDCLAIPTNPTIVWTRSPSSPKLSPSPHPRLAQSTSSRSSCSAETLSAPTFSNCGGGRPA